METPLKVEFKIGEIEFKAEGNPADVEKQRESFVNTLLPLAVESMVRTRNASAEKQQCSESPDVQILPENSQFAIPISSIDTQQSAVYNCDPTDFTRKSLNTYINKFGTVTDQDFVVLATYFEEMKTGQPVSITSEVLKQYYKDARRIKYSNLSQLLTELVKKGLLKDDEDSEKKTPKPYILTNEGLKFAREYILKPISDIKTKAIKSKRPRAKTESVYSSLNAEALNLKNYPEIKDQDNFKKQMMLILYIVYKEGHGDAFSTADVQCLMTDILGLPASINQINGVFKRQKIWFSNIVDETNKKSIKHRILTGAKDYAESIINID